jgi:hypothetical protein
LLALLEERIHITAEAMRVGGRDIERLCASPKTGTTVQHQVERGVRCVQKAWDVLVWKSCPFRSAGPPGREPWHT